MANGDYFRLSRSIAVGLGDAFLPDAGTQFPVMTFASRRGEFTCLNGCFLLGHDRRLLPVYGASNFTLATVGAPDPTNVSLSIGFEDVALVCWPAEFTGWSLYWNTNLSSNGWQLVPGARCLFADTNVVAEKFYRLHKP